MLKVNLATEEGNILHAHLVEIDSAEHVKHKSLSVITPSEMHGLFKTVTGTTAATTTVTSPNNKGALVLTDLIVGGERKQFGTLELRYTDDITTETIYKGSLNDAPVNLAISFKGRFYGWQNARLEIVTVTDFIYSIACGYYKVKNGLPFDDWNSRR